MEEDISFLLYALRNGYGGRKFVVQSKFYLALEALSKLSIEKKEKSPKELKEKIDEILLDIPDSHLTASLDKRYSLKREKVERRGNVGKNRLEEKLVWRVEQLKQKKSKILYISITKFPSHRDKIWVGFIEEVKSLLHTSDIAILDLRGNGGGDDTFGIKLSEVFSGKLARIPIKKQYVSQTPETYAIRINYFRLKVFNMKRRGLKPPTYLKELEKSLMSNFKSSLEDNLTGYKVRLLGKDSPSIIVSKNAFLKPIYILQDKACGSSCESTIDSFEFHKNVKKVGENTAGYIHFGNIGYIILPNSRVKVQIPSHYNEYFDKRFLEGNGISPDIRVPPGVDAYEFLKKLLGS